MVTESLMHWAAARPSTGDRVLLGGNALAAIANANARVVNPALQVVFSTALGKFQLTSFLDALQEVRLADLQAEPSIVTLDNRQASIQVGQEIPIRVLDANTANLGGATGAQAPRATVQMKQVGIILTVTPHITNNRQILLLLHAENSDAQLASSDVGFIFGKQSGDTQLLVGDGETAVIGGLTVTQTTQSKSGIPLLVDLPIIGRLFGETRTDDESVTFLSLLRLTSSTMAPQFPARRPSDSPSHPLKVTRMSIDLTRSRLRGIAIAAAAASIFGIAACNDTTSTNGTQDRTPPTVTLTPVSGTADTVVSFHTDAKDNLGLKTIHIQAVGAVGFVFDTVFTSAVTNIDLPFTLFSSRSVPPGTPVIITATAIDGAGNSSGIDTLRMATGNVPPPVVKVLSPFSGSSAVVGKSILVTVMGKSAIKVRSLGLFTTGPVVLADSTIYSSPLRDSLTMQDTIAIPATATPGTLTITPFLRDSLGQRAVGPSITITVQNASQINSVPVVNAYCTGARRTTTRVAMGFAWKSATPFTSKRTIRAASVNSVMKCDRQSVGQSTIRLRSFRMGSSRSNRTRSRCGYPIRPSRQ